MKATKIPRSALGAIALFSPGSLSVKSAAIIPAPQVKFQFEGKAPRIAEIFTRAGGEALLNNLLFHTIGREEDS